MLTSNPLIWLCTFLRLISLVLLAISAKIIPAMSAIGAKTLCDEKLGKIAISH